jgi:hypothetical protein
VARGKWLDVGQDGQSTAQSFSIRVVARFRPGARGSNDLAVPLHQRLKFRKKGENISLKEKEPESFLDAFLLGHVMRDPVRLPSSGKVSDRIIIERHLNSTTGATGAKGGGGGLDPFDGTPLAANQLVPVPELKSEIDAWQLRQRGKRDGGGGGVGGRISAPRMSREAVTAMAAAGGELTPDIMEALVEADRLRQALKAAEAAADDTRQGGGEGGVGAPEWATGGAFGADGDQDAAAVAAAEQLNAVNALAIEDGSGDGLIFPGEGGDGEAGGGGGDNAAESKGEGEGEEGGAGETLDERAGGREKRSVRVLSLHPSRATLHVGGQGLRSFYLTRVLNADCGQEEAYREAAQVSRGEGGGGRGVIGIG